MSVLEEIVAATRERVERLRAETDVDALKEKAGRARAVRPLRAALASDGAVIAEIKRRSPAKGDLNAGLDPASLAEQYVRGGAVALSVLTEPDFFGGSLADLEEAGAAGVPVLRKDFIVDEIQVPESRAAGADGLLLIARVLGDDLERLLKATESAGMDALVEIYDESDADLARAAGATLVGINNRDLATFEVDLSRTARLAPLFGPDVLVVGLSGVVNRTDADELRAAGARAILVGEGVVTAPDPAAAVRELV